MFVLAIGGLSLLPGIYFKHAPASGLDPRDSLLGTSHALEYGRSTVRRM